MIKTQNNDQNFFICVESQCNLNRVITNWDQLQQHNLCDHKILPKNKFESKVKFKLINFNQQQQIQFEEDLFLLTEQYQQQFTQRFQEILEHFKKYKNQFIWKQIQINNEQESLSIAHLIKEDLQKYINIFHDQMKPNQQQQVTMLLDEIQQKLNCMNNELQTVFQFFEEKFISDSLMSININQQNKEDASKQNLFSETQQLVINTIIEQENKYQKQNFYNKVEDMASVIEQNFQADQYLFQQESLIKNPQNDTDDQNDLESIPLKGYKLFQQQQYNYHPTEYVQKQNDDIMNQDAILNNHKDLYEEKVSVGKYHYEQDQYVQKNQKDSPSSKTYIGVRFDMHNSDKNLIYSQNYESFRCINEGIGLVEGAFSLENDAEINLFFSECQNKTFYAEIGILQVNKYGLFTGSFKQGLKGRLIYGIDEQGNLISRNRNVRGQLKISVNQEYLISYSSKKKMLYFISGDSEEYVDLYKDYGTFKFYVKLCGVKVSILN